MPAQAGDLIRPFIRARRSDVMRHLTRHGIPYSLDPSNKDKRFLRARVRRDVLPLLETISPRVVEHLCELAGDLEALDLPHVPMGRAQLRALAKAAADRDPAVRVSLPAGRVARVELSTGRIVVETTNGAKGNRKARHVPDDA